MEFDFQKVRSIYEQIQKFTPGTAEYLSYSLSFLDSVTKCFSTEEGNFISFNQQLDNMLSVLSKNLGYKQVAIMLREQKSENESDILKTYHVVINTEADNEKTHKQAIQESISKIKNSMVNLKNPENKNTRPYLKLMEKRAPMQNAIYHNKFYRFFGKSLDGSIPKSEKIMIGEKHADLSDLINVYESTLKEYPFLKVLYQDYVTFNRALLIPLFVDEKMIGVFSMDSPTDEEERYYTKKRKMQLFNTIANIFLLNVAITYFEKESEKTSLHTERVVEHAIGTGRELGLTPVDMSILKYGAMFHDLGKMAVADLVNKPTKFTLEDIAKVRDHTLIGANVLKTLRVVDQSIIKIVLEHHANLDGSGYPNSYKPTRLSQICNVCDSYCAMVEGRIYRAMDGLPHEITTRSIDAILLAIEELKRCSNQSFDEQLWLKYYKPEKTPDKFYMGKPKKVFYYEPDIVLALERFVRKKSLNSF